MRNGYLYADLSFSSPSHAFDECDQHENRCIIMEYADGGDLRQQIEAQEKKNALFSEEQILRWFTQVSFRIALHAFAFGLDWIGFSVVCATDLLGTVVRAPSAHSAS